MRNYSDFTFDYPAVEMMEQEHRLIEFLMEEWRPISLKLERNKFSHEQGYEAFFALQTKIQQFAVPLLNHIEKEERYLLPLLVQYIGSDQGVILSAEQNHQNIRQYIRPFLDMKKDRAAQLTLQQMRDIAKNASKIYEQLTCHFFKVETFIFPMIRDILEPSEQHQLFKDMTTKRN